MFDRLHLLSRGGGFLCVLKDVQRALEESDGVGGFTRAKLHHAPFPQTLRPGPWAALRVQQRGAVEPPGSLGVAL